VIHQASDIRQDVSVRLAHDGQLSVAGDRDLLKQLVLNLVDNGVKFSSAGGEVVVSLRRVDGSAEIVVADLGPGMPADQLELIFERFYRVPGNDSRTVGGAGIGLAISRWIARSHGGELRVESEVGQGSRFVVTLPLVGDTPVKIVE
jgi:signal transduction histidine kinase